MDEDKAESLRTDEDESCPLFLAQFSSSDDNFENQVLLENDSECMASISFEERNKKTSELMNEEDISETNFISRLNYSCNFQPDLSASIVANVNNPLDNSTTTNSQRENVHDVNKPLLLNKEIIQGEERKFEIRKMFEGISSKECFGDSKDMSKENVMAKEDTQGSATELHKDTRDITKVGGPTAINLDKCLSTGLIAEENVDRELSNIAVANEEATATHKTLVEEADTHETLVELDTTPKTKNLLDEENIDMTVMENLLEDSEMSVCEEIADRPSNEEIVEKPIIEDVNEKQIFKETTLKPVTSSVTTLKPVTEEVAEQPVNEKITERLVIKEVLEQPINKEVSEQPISEEVTQQPTYEVTQQSLNKFTEKPVIEEVIDQPVTVETTMNKPNIEEVSQQPIIAEMTAESLIDKTSEKPTNEDISKIPRQDVNEIQQHISKEKSTIEDIIGTPNNEEIDTKPVHGENVDKLIDKEISEMERAKNWKMSLDDDSLLGSDEEDTKNKKGETYLDMSEFLINFSNVSTNTQEPSDESPLLCLEEVENESLDSRLEGNAEMIKDQVIDTSSECSESENELVSEHQNICDGNVQAENEFENDKNIISDEKEEDKEVNLEKDKSARVENEEFDRTDKDTVTGKEADNEIKNEKDVDKSEIENKILNKGAIDNSNRLDSQETEVGIDKKKDPIKSDKNEEMYHSKEKEKDCNKQYAEEENVLSDKNEEFNGKVTKPDVHVAKSREEKRKMIMITTDGLPKSAKTQDGKGSVIEVLGEDIEEATFSRVVIIGNSYISRLSSSWPKDSKIKPFFICKKKLSLHHVFSMFCSHPFLKGCKNVMLIIIAGISDIIKLKQFKALSCPAAHSNIKFPRGLKGNSELLNKLIDVMKNTKTLFEAQGTISVAFSYIPSFSFHKIIEDVFHGFRAEHDGCICYYYINKTDMINTINEFYKLHTSINQHIFSLKLNLVGNNFFEFVPLNISFKDEEWFIDPQKAVALEAKVREVIFPSEVYKIDECLQNEFTGMREMLMGKTSDFQTFIIGDSWLKVILDSWSGESKIKPFFYFKEGITMKEIKDMVLALVSDEKTLVITVVPTGELFDYELYPGCENHKQLHYPVPKLEMMEYSKEFCDKICKMVDSFQADVRQLRNNCKIVFMTCYPVRFEFYYKYLTEEHEVASAGHLIQERLVDFYKCKCFMSSMDNVLKSINAHVVAANMKYGLHTCDIFSLITVLSVRDKFIIPSYVPFKSPPLSFIKKLTFLIKEYVHSIYILYKAKKFSFMSPFGLKVTDTTGSLKEEISKDEVKEMASKSGLKKILTKKSSGKLGLVSEADESVLSDIDSPDRNVIVRSLTLLPGDQEAHDKHCPEHVYGKKDSNTKAGSKHPKEEKDNKPAKAYPEEVRYPKNKKDYPQEVNHLRDDVPCPEEVRYPKESSSSKFKEATDTLKSDKLGKDYHSADPKKYSGQSYGKNADGDNYYSSDYHNYDRTYSEPYRGHYSYKSYSNHYYHEDNRAAYGHRYPRSARSRSKDRTYTKDSSQRWKSSPESKRQRRSKSHTKSHSKRSKSRDGLSYKAVEKRKRRSISSHKKSKRRCSSSTKEEAIANLWEIHSQECEMYRKNPDNHPDYHCVKRMWFEVMVSQGFSPNDFTLQEYWNDYWIKKLETIFKDSWEEKKSKCLSLLFSKAARKSSSERSSDSSSSRSRSSSSDKCSRKRAHTKSRNKHQHYKKSKKSKKKKSRSRKHSRREESTSSSSPDEELKSEPYSGNSLKHQLSPIASSSDFSFNDASILSVEELERRVNEFMKKSLHGASYKTSVSNIPKLQESLSSGSTSARGSGYQMPSKKESNNLIDVTSILSQISDRFGALGMSLSVLHHNVVDTLNKGKNPLDCVDDDAKVMLELIGDKVKRILTDEDLTLVQRAIIQEANDRLCPLLESLGKKPQTTIGLDLNTVAKATLGMQVQEIVGFIKASLAYKSASNFTLDDLMKVYLEVKAIQMKLVTDKQSSPSKLSAKPSSSSIPLFPSFVHSQQEASTSRIRPSLSAISSTSKSAIIKSQFMSLSMSEKLRKFAQFHFLPFEEKSFLLSHLDELEQSDKKLAQSLRFMISQNRTSFK